MIRSHIFSVFVALAFAVTTAQAGILTGVTVDPGLGPPLSVGEIKDFSPDGFKMDGMQVTAKFSDGSSVFSETVDWKGTSGNTGEAIGEDFDWLLTETHNTFFSTWNLTNQEYNPSGPSLKLIQLKITAGVLGNTVFDLQKNDFDLPGDVNVMPGGTDFDFEGTFKSERGWTFDPFNLGDGNFDGPEDGGTLAVSATYRNAVKLDSAAGPVGDLWTELQIDFGGDARGLVSAQMIGGGPNDRITFSFKADTDVFGPAEPVPEPSSLIVMLGLGLCGAGTVFARRRARL